MSDVSAKERALPPYYRGKSWWRRPQYLLPIVGIIVTGVLVLFFLQPWRTVRVTDGSEILRGYLENVERLILAENKGVDNSGEPFVSIAYMTPIRIEKDDPLTEEAVLHQLQGAYLAQYWSNHPDDRPAFGSNRPLIKLLLADSGPLGTAWESTITELRAEAASQHLVAVVGLGLSLTSTKEAISALDSAELAMVASVVTSGEIAARNLWRVAPTNSDEAAATVKYIETTPEWRSATPAAPYTAYLVQDKAARESYSADLSKVYRQMFRADAAHRFLPVQGEFDSSKPAVGNALDAQVNMVCSIRPQAVLFAGRSHELELLIRALAGRWCANETPVTIITADDATQLAIPLGPNRNPLWRDQSRIQVLYSTFATPQAWEKYPDAVLKLTSQQFGNCPHCFRTLFNDELEDGHAIMSHDAMMVAVKAARGVASPDNNFIPQSDALPNGFYKINSANPVPGASGLICYQGGSDESGHVPFNKAVPIMQLMPGGQRVLVTLSSRLGTPPGQTCPSS